MKTDKDQPWESSLTMKEAAEHANSAIDMFERLEDMAVICKAWRIIDTFGRPYIKARMWRLFISNGLLICKKSGTLSDGESLVRTYDMPMGKNPKLRVLYYDNTTTDSRLTTAFVNGNKVEVELAPGMIPIDIGFGDNTFFVGFTASHGQLQYTATDLTHYTGVPLNESMFSRVHLLSKQRSDLSFRVPETIL